MKFKAFKQGLCIPFIIFLLLVVIIPMFFIVYYAFTDADGHFTFSAATSFFTDLTQLNVLLVSILIAAITTLICIVIGFPIAWILARRNLSKGSLIVMLFVVPMWINFVLRTGALRDLLNTVLGWFGSSTGELPYLSAVIGLVTDFLPFTIIPLNSTLLKLDKSQIEAAKDLGCNPIKTFTKSIIPQSMPGIISACSMVFMPAISAYVITDVMSERQIMIFGNAVQIAFDTNDWNGGSFLALIMLLIIFVTMIVTRKFQDSSEKEKASW